MSTSRGWLRGLGWSVLVLVVATGAMAARTTTRVSLSSGGVQANGSSDWPAISADGRYVAFVATANNLVAGDTNGSQDVFRHDRLTGTTIRVSVTSAGVQAESPSYSPSISADGRYVAFMSTANNLIPDDVNIWNDVFVRDCVAGTTTLISVSSLGNQGNDESYGPSISADGRYVAFVSMADNLVPSDANGNTDVFVRDRSTGSTSLVSIHTSGAQANDWSFDPSISNDGRYVAFCSYATNLVAGDTNGYQDIFVRDRTGATTRRVSVATGGAQSNYNSLLPHISGNGRYVVFESGANNLVPSDTNGSWDAFMRDLTGATTTRVSVWSSGAQSPLDSGKPVVSADGRFVAFSTQSKLVAADTNLRVDVYVRDRLKNATVLASAATSGALGNGDSANASISGDGRYVAFVSDASTLVTGDTNGRYDVFVNDRGPFPVPKVATWAPKGTTVARNANIVITFSLGMVRSSAQNALRINGVSAKTFGGAFTWAGKKMTFNPSTNFKAGTSYKIVVGTAARSVEGIAMAKPFTWTFTTAPAASPAAVTVAAVPTAAGAQIALNLAAAAEVAVSIRNLAGREIAVLSPGQLEAGMHSLLWNGKSHTGTRAPGGVYFVHVKARQTSGMITSAVGSLRL